MEALAIEPNEGRDSLALQNAVGPHRTPDGDLHPPLQLVSRRGAFGPEELQAVLAAYEGVLKELDLVKREDLVTRALARKTMEFAMAGEFNPTRLRDLVLDWIGP